MSVAAYAFQMKSKWSGGRDFEVDWSKSSLQSDYFDRLKRTRAGTGVKPTRLGRWTSGASAIVTRARYWPDVLASLVGPAYLVSERIAAALEGVPASQLELFKVRVKAGKGTASPAQCYLLNFCATVDALNLAASRVELNTIHPDVESLLGPKAASAMGSVIDPVRLPVGTQAFVTKWMKLTCVGRELGERLLAAKLVDLELTPLPGAPEDEDQRWSLLARLRKQAIEIRKSVPKPPKRLVVKNVDELERLLGVTIPPRVREFWEGEEARTFELGEVFSPSEAVNTTNDLRAWKDVNWPQQMITIAEDGMGGYFALDLQSANGADCPVVYFDHEIAVDHEAIAAGVGPVEIDFEVIEPTFDSCLVQLKAGKGFLG